VKAWQVVIEPLAAKELKKLANSDRKRIMQFLRERIATTENPRSASHALTGALKGLWSYRIGDFRVIAKIQDQIVTVLVVRIGNRRDVYI
jgi:mRNA interferase RelE/StbE